MRFFRPAVAAIAFLLTSAPPLVADMARHMGPMADVAGLGQHGPWLAEDKGGWLTITGSDPSAMSYIHKPVPEAMRNAYRASVNLVAMSQAPDGAMAGLIFNLAPDGTYIGAAIGSDNRATLIVRTGEGLRMQGIDHAEVKNDGTDILSFTVSDGGTHVQFRLNGTDIFKLDNPNGFTPNTGILFRGDGVMGFTDYRLDPAG